MYYQQRINAWVFCLLLVPTMSFGAAPTEPARWRPVTIPTFDVQLNDPPVASQVPTVTAAELDGDIDPAILKQVKLRNVKLICYINAGSWESYRSDQKAFPKAVLGKAYDGYPQERWLDIRNIPALAPIMRARMDNCKRKGFDAIDPDNVNGYENNTGFPITALQQQTYNTWLMNEAHARGLAIALKNTPGLVKPLVTAGYDFSVTESCFAEGSCASYLPFIQAKRPVLDLEYLDERMNLTKFCSASKKLGINAILKRSSSSIDQFRQTCP